MAFLSKYLDSDLQAELEAATESYARMLDETRTMYMADESIPLNVVTTIQVKQNHIKMIRDELQERGENTRWSF